MKIGRFDHVLWPTTEWQPKGHEMSGMVVVRWTISYRYKKKQIEKQENKKGTHRQKSLGSVDLKGPSIKHPNDNLAVYILYTYTCICEAFLVRCTQGML